MKKSYFISLSLFAIIVSVYISGCSDSITSSTVITPDKYQARTETELSLSSASSVIPGAVVYVDLEHTDSPASGVTGDTGPIGEDIIPYSYTETATHRIKLDADAMFKAKLVSDAGTTIYELNNPGDTARVNIPAGNYKLHLTSLVTSSSDGAYGVTQPVFIQRDMDAINSGSGAPPQGGFSPEDLNTLLTTNKCIGCDLQNWRMVELKFLAGVDLSYANLSNSYLVHIWVNRGTFVHTNWTGAVGAGNFDSAKFIYSELKKANFSASLIGSVFQRINFDKTNFQASDMRHATIDSGTGNAKFVNADLRYSTISNIIYWHDMSFDGANMRGVKFSKVHIKNSFFGNAVLDSAKFDRCYFEMTNLNNTILTNTTFTDFRGDGSSFDGADFSGAKMFNFNIVGGSMRGVILVYTLVDVADFSSADMCNQDRTRATMRHLSYNSETLCLP